jgi:hypothetical protein
VTLACEHMSILLQSFHKRLVTDIFDSSISDTDAFLIFHILHEFELHVRPGVLADTQSGVIPAITQRHAALCLAALWRGSGNERSRYEYWYRRWNSDWGSYGHSEHLSHEEAARLQELLAIFRSHDWITDLSIEE